MKAVLFDFDYTLVDSSDAILHCFYTATDQLELTRKASGSIKSSIGMTLENMYKKLYSEDVQNTEEFIRLYMIEADKSATDMTTFFSDAEELLTFLRKEQFKIGIVSTKNRSRINESLVKYNMDQYFDIVIGGEDVKEHKPSPEGIQKAIEELHLTLEDIIYVGDSLFDFNAAKNAQVLFYAVLNGMTDKKTFVEQGLDEKQICLNLKDVINKFK